MCYRECERRAESYIPIMDEVPIDELDERWLANK